MWITVFLLLVITGLSFPWWQERKKGKAVRKILEWIGRIIVIEEDDEFPDALSEKKGSKENLKKGYYEIVAAGRYRGEEHRFRLQP